MTQWLRISKVHQGGFNKLTLLTRDLGKTSISDRKVEEVTDKKLIFWMRAITLRRVITALYKSKFNSKSN